MKTSPKNALPRQLQKLKKENGCSFWRNTRSIIGHRSIYLNRLNPIIMMALTTALALTPLALKGGEPGNEIQSPMAIVILGGLLSATVLNLMVMLGVYYYLSGGGRE